MKTFQLSVVFVLAVVLGAGVYTWFSNEQKTSSSDHARESDSATACVLAVYKQLEKAMQTGDGNLYMSLISQKRLEKANNTKLLEQMRQGFPADPSVRYEVRGVKTKGDHAAILGKLNSNDRPPHYHSVKFILDSGSWKIVEVSLDSEPINPSALEAAVPPPEGAFGRTGSPWDKVPYASENTKWFKEDQIYWKFKGASDESFLYLRFESKVLLPATGTELSADDVKSLKCLGPETVGTGLEVMEANSPAKMLPYSVPEFSQ